MPDDTYRISVSGRLTEQEARAIANAVIAVKPEAYVVVGALIEGTENETVTIHPGRLEVERW